VIRSTARCLQALLLVGSLCATGQSFANPGPSDVASPGASDTAGELFDKGNAFYRQSHWAEAEVQFQKAWNLKQSFDVAANLGDCELQIGQNREAAEHLAFAVRAFPVSGKPALLDRLRQRFAEARALTSALHIRVDIKGAEVTVDGRAVGVAPLADEVFVDPGARVVEARLEGYDVGRANVTAAKGATQDVTLTLPRKGVDPLVPTKSGPNKALLIGGGVAAGLAAGAGVVLAILAGAKTNDADAKIAEFKTAGLKNPCLTRSTDCDTIAEDRGAHDSLSNAALVSFVGAGVLAVGTLTYGLMAKRPNTTPAQGFRVMPMIGATQGGVLLVGSW
jgi:hypothetical protein